MVNIEIKQNAAVVRPNRPIADEKDALDVIHAVRYQTGRNNMLLERSAFVPEMFDLAAGVTAKVLKAFIQEKCAWPLWATCTTAISPPCGM